MFDSRPRLLRYGLEGAAVIVAYGLFRALPLDAASSLGGWLGRHVGPRLGMSRLAAHNLRLIFPEKPEPEIREIVRGMWDNLARVLAEYPHLPEFVDGPARDRIDLVGAEHVDKALAEGRMLLFVSAHYGNWEVAPALALHRGLPIHLVYRSPNNPVADWLVRRIRRHTAVGLLRKSQLGTRQMVKVVRDGGVLGILADQKLSEGVSVPFLGRPAMTPTVVADMALKYGALPIPVRVERTHGSRFRVTVHRPLEFESSGDRARDVREAVRRMNDVIGAWIRERPEQWLWLHRRWPESA
ncbi:MAG: lysophospholipid acyltransferase family protein [Alphaproteobacteria bacterium]